MVEITSIEKYINAIMKMKRENEKEGFPCSYQWFFRGQKDLSWSVVPNAFRDSGLKNEYSTIQSAIRQNPFEFRTLTGFETLTKLQHYGLGTRLLDGNRQISRRMDTHGIIVVERFATFHYY